LTKLALFDLDGTLIDSEVGIVASTQYALTKLGAPVPPREVLRTWIGPPLRVTFATVLGDDPDMIERAVALYRERFADVGWREHEVYAGVADAIDALTRDGVMLAVVTSKPDLYAGRIVASLPFGHRFARVYSVHAGSAHSGKAEMIADALADFATAPEQAAMVGDRHFDITGARANGVRGIGAAWGFGSVAELDEAGAHAIAHAPEELPGLLAPDRNAGAVVV
jgi:phosphoglycolate phosphatase